MELLALHIYHLDDGEESDKIIKLLKSTGIEKKWNIEPPSEETNAIFIPVELNAKNLESWKMRDKKLSRSLSLLSKLDKDVIDNIKSSGLSTAMRIHTDEFYLPLPGNFVAECGRLGLEICVFNTKL